MDKTSLDFRNREAGFKALEAGTFDLLVIGAGITGCGVARDAALRGLTVALVDAGDVSSGTSSRSSKLIHGGVRYLAQGDIGVVKQAANERRVVRRIAPHLARTNPWVILVRSKLSMTKFQAGLWSYEKLGHVNKDELHTSWSRDQLRAEESTVAAEDFAGAVVYPEYHTDDARLTLANARSAVGAGAVLVTYAAAKEIIFDNGRACGAAVRSTLPGEDLGARVRARLVVNAAGPWVDSVRRLEDGQAKNKLQLTKGIHVVITRERLPVNRTIVMSAPDRRGIYVIPHGQCVFFGTTDTFYPRPEYWPEITREDISYLLDSSVPYFGGRPFEDKDIVSLWAGLRPLLGEEGKKPSEISRRDEIMEGPAGMLTVAGGKLTAYRAMAEHLVDRCEKELGRKPTPTSTTEEPLPGGDFTGTLEELTARLEREAGFSPIEAERTAMLYGSETLEVFAQERGPEAEVSHAVLHEGALTLEDYWVRRTSRARFDPDGGLGALETAAKRMAELLGWPDEERARQVDHCLAVRRAEMSALDHDQGE